MNASAGSSCTKSSKESNSRSAPKPSIRTRLPCLPLPMPRIGSEASASSSAASELSFLAGVVASNRDRTVVRLDVDGRRPARPLGRRCHLGRRIGCRGWRLEAAGARRAARGRWAGGTRPPWRGPTETQFRARAAGRGRTGRRQSMLREAWWGLPGASNCGLDAASRPGGFKVAGAGPPSGTPGGPCYYSRKPPAAAKIQRQRRIAHFHSRVRRRRT